MGPSILELWRAISFRCSLIRVFLLFLHRERAFFDMLICMVFYDRIFSIMAYDIGMN